MGLNCSKFSNSSINNSYLFMVCDIPDYHFLINFHQFSLLKISRQLKVMKPHLYNFTLIPNYPNEIID